MKRILDMDEMTDDKCEALLVAARAVVDAWETSDLAAAVRELASVLDGEEEPA
jgi:predicted DNA-binding transcriptional regulator YafY